MATELFNVKHDLDKFRPSRWDGDYVRKFGPRNEGFLVEATDAADCKAKVSKEHNLNPFYLVIAKV